MFENTPPVNLHDRTRVHLPAVHEPKDHGEHDHAAEHGHGPVHRLRGDRHRRRPEGEENPDDGVEDGEDVDSRPQNVPQLEWAPVHVRRRGGEALVQESARGDQEGGVEGGDDEADECVEGGGGPDVDKGKDAADENHEANRPQR